MAPDSARGAEAARNGHVIQRGGAACKAETHDRVAQTERGEIVRINFSDDEDYPGQFDLWQGNCERSLRGKRGQTELRELREALLGLLEKRLILNLLYDGSGDVCAVGAYAKHKGLDLSKFDPEDETDQVGIEAGMPRLVAWKIVEVNDYQFESLTPEQRYEKMLRWVESKLIAK